MNTKYMPEIYEAQLSGGAGAGYTTYTIATTRAMATAHGIIILCTIDLNLYFISIFIVNIPGFSMHYNGFATHLYIPEIEK